jgi:hypothetical protein
MNSAADPLHAVIPVLQERQQVAANRVGELEKELASAREELEDATEALSRIERLAGIDRPAPPTDAKPWSRARHPEAPEGSEAVRTALMESPKPLPLPELWDAVRKLGWIPQTDEPERAVRAAANRLRKKDSDFDYVDRRFIYRPRHVVDRPGQGAFLTEGDQ